MAIDISSPWNDRIKWLIRLRNRRHRDREGVFVVEGERLYRRAIESGRAPEITFLATDARIETVGPKLVVAPSVLDRASYRQRSEGVIAVFAQMTTRLSTLDVPSQPLVLVAEDIEKPGNLGGMLRTAAAAGADAFIAVGATVDAYNPNVIRASTGAVFTVPLAITDWDEFSPWVEQRGVRVVCASPSAADPVWDATLTGPLALVVGGEDKGLSVRALSEADSSVVIPQTTGTVDSLNVSVAAAVLLFEARRQRRT